MKCPFCSHQDTQVIETRVSEDGDCIRRRRQCGACEKRFTTYERPEVNFPAVVKKDGRRVEYDRHKLLGSFKLALRKRPGEHGADRFGHRAHRGEAAAPGPARGDLQPHRRAGHARAQESSTTVAYIRYASVYRSFEDIDEFRALVDEVRK